MSEIAAIDHGSQPRETWRPGVETRLRVSALQGAAQLCIFEQWVGPGAGPPTHWHPVEEVLTVIAGQAEMWIDERHVVLTGGQSLVVPALRRHGFRNSGGEVLHVEAVLASASFETWFDGAAEPVRRWLPPA
jgi:mannose-6-phosphate isomerase-like protein (cupin superfamily)